MEDDVTEDDVPSIENLATLKDMALRMLEIEDAIGFHEECLKQCKLNYDELRHRVIPDFMMEAGVHEFKTETHHLKIGQVVRGSLPQDPDRRSLALAWLEEHDGADIIKGTVTAQFSRGQTNAQQDFIAELEEYGIAYASKRDVHHSTLEAWARERMRDGKPVELDLLGLFSGYRASVKERKR